MYSGYLGFILKVKVPEHKVVHYPPSSAEFKNELIYTFSPHNFIFRPGWLTRYSDLLRAVRYGVRIEVRSRFFSRVQTGPEADPIVIGSLTLE
jgi:hypothetical protein